MNEQQYEKNKAILANAVDTATHIDNEGDYWSMGNDDEPSVFNYMGSVWDYCETEAPLRKLSDIKSLCDQYERITELEKALRDIVNDSVEVTANARNTPSVRKQFELGGYIKHYVVPRHTIVNAMNLKEQVPREPTQELYDEAFND